MDTSRPHVDLQQAAVQAMRAHGFEPEFGPEVQQQLAGLKAHPPPVALGAGIRDLRGLPWSSIDNDTSRDLDQLEVAESLPEDHTKVMVAIADVDVFVPKHSAIDDHAANATTTVYTGTGTANEVVARMLEAGRVSSIRRVVKTPEPA